MNNSRIVIVMVGLAVMLALVLGAISQMQENKEWNEFIQVHHCVYTGVTTPSNYSLSPVAGSSKFVINDDGNRSAFKCDEGLIVWKKN